MEHQLTVNGVYLGLKHGALPQGVTFRRWESFFAPIVPGLKLIPDGYAELDTPSGILAAFLEIDLGHEHRPIWKQKVERYLQLALTSAPEAEAFHRPFRVLVLAPTDRRVQSIRTAVAPITDKIFWFRSLESIHREGLFAPVWLGRLEGVIGGLWLDLDFFESALRRIEGRARRSDGNGARASMPRSVAGCERKAD